LRLVSGDAFKKLPHVLQGKRLTPSLKISRRPFPKSLLTGAAWSVVESSPNQAGCQGEMPGRAVEALVAPLAGSGPISYERFRRSPIPGRGAPPGAQMANELSRCGKRRTMFVIISAATYAENPAPGLSIA
jgi:hypothetical protein